MSKKENTSGNVCDFCGQSESMVFSMVSGANAKICNFCTENAVDIFTEQLHDDFSARLFLDDEELLKFDSISKNPLKPKGKKEKHKFSLNYTPKQIKDYLDQYIIGQNETKRIISVAVYNHFKRIGQKLEDDIEIEKSNILLVGETGTGKTLFARTIAKLLKVPFAIVDATVFTEAGYVGEDVESMLTRLLQASDYNVENAERGIVYIDEIDKLARRGDNPSLTKDVGGEGVQQSLLKMLEGTDVLVPPQGGRKHPDQPLIKVNTRNILFICGGAFSGIDKIIARRLNTSTIGFDHSSTREEIRENVLHYVSHHDVKNFGLIPELLGRLPVLTSLKPLDTDTLRAILTEPKNALVKQYQRLFELENIDLQIEDSALNAVVQTAWEFKLGARGLRSILELILNDRMFEFNGRNAEQEVFIITKDFVENKIKQSKIELIKAS